MSKSIHFQNPDDKFFDSSDYRCCFKIFHAKIGAFVFCTWLLHEIVLASLFLLSQKEFKEGNPSANSIMLIGCRVVQLVSVGILYVGLWRHKRRWLLPFVLVQVRFLIFLLEFR